MAALIPIFLAREILAAYPWDTLLAIAVVVVVALVPLAVVIMNTRQRKRTERLRAQFGPDYDDAVNEYGDWRIAEQQLLRRRRERNNVAGHKP